MSVKEPMVDVAADGDAMEVDQSDTWDEPVSGEVGEEVKLTPDGGVIKKILVQGEGDETPEKGDEVQVHYVGTLGDGTVFDSSRERNDTFKFKLGQGNVIKGWDIGVKTMKKGEKAMLICGPQYAYGEHGSPPKIPANATLNFEVELLEWTSQKDIMGDGGIIKTTIVEASGWQKPTAEDEVRVKYTIKVRGGDVVESSPEDGAEFVVKSGSPIPAFERVLTGMTKGEKVSLVIRSDYGYGAEGKPGVVKPDDTLEAELELVSWKTIQKVTPDGGVVKKTVTEGTKYATPGTDAQVRIRYTASLPDGTVFDERGEGNELEYLADDDQVIPGLDLAVMKMKEGEVADVTIGPKYAFGLNSDPAAPFYNPKVPANATVTYRVELVSFVKAKDSWELNESEKVAEATARKEHGNLKFKQSRWEAAIKRYKNAVQLIEHDKSFSDENKAAVLVIKRSANLNLAAAHLKLGQLKDAIAACNKVLEKEVCNSKALYRRAQAYLAQSDYVEAEQDIKKALEAEPASRDLRALQAQWKRAYAEHTKKEKRIYGNIFKKMAKADAKEEKAKGKQTTPLPQQEQKDDGAGPSTSGSEHAPDQMAVDPPADTKEAWHPASDEVMHEVAAQ